MDKDSSQLVVEHPSIRYFLFGAFFLTGATGLIYQILWSRLLILTFGYTIYSVSIVVAVFMGGIAIGSVLGGILSDRLKNPMKAYGMTELAVGVIAALTYPLLMRLPYAAAYLKDFFEIPYYGFSPVTVMITAGVLLPPTILMGFTLPLLSRALTRVPDSAALDVGTLYSVNTIGAAIGCLLAGFLLIAIFGISRTIMIAASINIIIGIASVALSGGISLKTAAPSGAGREETLPASAKTSPVSRHFIFWAFFISGFVSLAYEVVWIRIFSPYLENSTYAFSLILGIFLVGIGVGGWKGRKLASSQDSSSRGYGLCLISVSTATGVGLTILYLFIYFFSPVLPPLGILLSKPFLIARVGIWIILIVLPSTFFMGMSFPFIAMWAAKEFKKFGGRTGKLYAANTVGSVLGAMGAGFLMLPLLGTRDSLILLSLVNIAAGFVLFYLNSETRKNASVLVVLLILFFAILRLSPDPNLFALNLAYKNRTVIAFREDPDVNVTLLENRQDERMLLINLKPVSGSSMTLTPWMAHLPLFLFEGGTPQKMLNIGLGIGHTFYSALKHPSLDVTVAELVPSVAKLFSEFNPRANDMLSNPRGHIIIGDGRNYLLRSNSRYDVISIDPTPPLYGTGAVNLYTADFFEIVKEKLSGRGILLLRIPASADEYSIKLLLRAAVEVFPHVSLWQPPFRGKIGFSVIASPYDYRFTPQGLKDKVTGALFLDEAWKELLLKTQPVLIADREKLIKFTEKTPLLTDDRPYLEFPLLKRVKE